MSRLEHAERVRHGDHQRRHILGHRRGERVDVDRAAAVRFQLFDLVAGEGRRGRVRAVRGIGDEDVLARVAALRQRLVHHQDAGQLAVRAGHRLQRHARHAEDLHQRLLDVPQQREIALHLVIRLQRMRQREARRARDLFVQPRVVLHRARAERIEAGVDRDVQFRQPREVPDDVDLGDFDFVRDLVAHQRRRQRPSPPAHREPEADSRGVRASSARR